MGTLTLTELKDEITRALGNRTDMADRLTRFLNLAQQRIARIHDFEELQQITDSTFVITANATTDKKLSFANLREIHSFRVLNDSESIKLKQVSTRLWDKTIPQPEYFSRGVPSHYTIWQRTAEMWKVPDQAYDYQIRWTSWPTDFSDASPSAVSDYNLKDELLIQLSSAYAFDSLSKTVEADRKYKNVGALMQEALLMDAKEPDLEFAPSKEVFKDFGNPEYWRDPFVLNVSGE
jgi:hypothetical protein